MTPDPYSEPHVVRYREIAADRREEALARGYPLRDFFPHRFYFLPKCGPDGLKLAQRMCGASGPEACWEIVLYASAATVAEFPAALFFDPDLVWHQQQFGRIGQIATANLWVDGPDLYTMVHISDLVQRISRRREHKTRIENRFNGWHHWLLNAIANFALTHDLERIYSPVADFARQHTDPKRNVQRELFERVYDRDVHKRFAAQPQGNWWRIDVRPNQQRILVATSGADTVAPEKRICIMHDVERGLGHLDVDPAFARTADDRASASLTAMLHVEQQLDVQATYNLVGTLFGELRSEIEGNGHCLAFHSYDHQVTPPTGHPTSSTAADHPDLRQLARCRAVDYRIKGYRPPRSLVSPGLNEQNLCYHNFEWLASSHQSLGLRQPRLQSGIVKIPVLFDDYPLHTGRLSYAEWEQQALHNIAEKEFCAFGLHDCYAPYWLPHYERFVETIRTMGMLRTLDEVAAAETLRNAD